MANRNSKKAQEDFSLKETSPNITAGKMINSSSLPTALDLVEHMEFLYVRIVRARDLPATCDPYVEVKLGNYKGTTRFFEKMHNPEWNQVFAFAKERIQDTVMEVVVKDKVNVDNEVVGKVSLVVGDIPKRIPPDSPLAPQWHRLEAPNGSWVRGELMFSAWIGTQADEAFPDAWHSDASSVSGEEIANTCSKVYLSPRLWYLRVNVIQAQDLLLNNRTGNSEIFIQAFVGNIALRSRSANNEANPVWNEDLMFVAAEPFDEPLIVTVKQGNSDKHESLGTCVVPVRKVKKRVDNTPPDSIWYSLERPGVVEGELQDLKFASKLNMRISLDGGYHVLDEITQHSSDLLPSDKTLWRPSVGILELGILSATGLLGMKCNNNRTDAYCVAKYGPKWVRTRTIADSVSPKWNEQYTWEVYDPCTVITIVVFDNAHLQGGSEGIADRRIGKVRIRLSSLETDRIYTHSYPLVDLLPLGAKKMGELQLSIRFSCPSLINVLQSYALPLLPHMHYISPLSMFQLDSLRNQAVRITSMRLTRAEPPLRREVVEYVLDGRANVWSMRKGRANFYRIVGLVGGFVSFFKWIEDIRSWENSITSSTIYLVFLLMFWFPELVLPTMFFSLGVVGLWRYKARPRHPPHMDMRLSQADTTSGEELEEEFDTFPSSAAEEKVRKRYERLRSIAGRALAVISDLATQGERVESVLSWRDPRATTLFMMFCLVAGIVTYVVRFRIIVFVSVTYLMRPPRFRTVEMPAIPHNFLRRMPARSDSMI